MDPTIIAAVITAIGTIIGNLITALIINRNQTGNAQLSSYEYEEPQQYEFENSEVNLENVFFLYLKKTFAALMWVAFILAVGLLATLILLWMILAFLEIPTSSAQVSPPRLLFLWGAVSIAIQYLIDKLRN